MFLPLDFYMMETLIDNRLKHVIDVLIVSKYQNAKINIIFSFIVGFISCMPRGVVLNVTVLKKICYIHKNVTVSEFNIF